MRKPSRSTISFRMRSAISRCWSLRWSGIRWKKASASTTDRCVAWLMSSPAILTASASGLRRAPWQVSHGCADWYLTSSSRIQALSVWSRRRLRLPITPSNGLLTSYDLLAVDEGERDGLAVACRGGSLSCTSLGRSSRPGGVEAEAERAREAAQHLHVIGRGRVGLGPGDDRALLDRQVVVGDDEVLVEHQLLAEPVAGRARALRGVEREQARLDLGDGEAADGAGELLGEDDAVGGDAGALHRAARSRPRPRGPARRRRRGRHRRGRRRASARSRSFRRGAWRCRCGHDEAVDDDLDVVLELLVERGRLVDLVDARRRCGRG